MMGSGKLVEESGQAWHVVPVRLRTSPGRTVVAPSWSPGGSPEEKKLMEPTAPIAPSEPPVSPLRRGARPVIALVEAVPSGAEAMAGLISSVLTSAGHRCGVVSLDPQNRLGIRMGCLTRSATGQWRHASGLWIDQGLRLVVPGPAVEDELDSETVERALKALYAETDGMVIDLGCRWTPKLFRPALHLASQIWVMTRAGQWSGAEMRLEQAEFSGWTDMGRVRVVVVGDGTPPLALGAPVAAALPDVSGEEARAFVTRELGRV